MKLKTIVNGAVLFIGLGLTTYAWLNGFRLRFNVESVAVEQKQNHEFERWNLKPVYVQDSNNTAIHLNMQMIGDGYAWHYTKYSDNCLDPLDFATVQELAQKVWEFGRETLNPLGSGERLISSCWIEQYINLFEFN